MFLFFSLVGFAQMSDSLDERVRSVLANEISQRLASIAVTTDDISVKVKSTGLKTTNRCKIPYEIDVDFSAREDFQGLIKANLSMTDAGGDCGRYHFYPRVEVWMKMPVAKHAAMAGETVVVDYQIKRYDLTNGPLLSRADLELSARANLAKGQVITLDKVRRVPTNRDGDQVELRVKSGSINIKSNGKLMRDAYLGEQVKVLSFATSNVIQGTLTKKGIVEIGAGK